MARARLCCRVKSASAACLATKLHADGRHNQLLYVDGGPSTTGTVGKLRMQGREVFRHAVTNLSNVCTRCWTRPGWSRFGN
jgi:3-oxoacyl-[acyl-carrier-protein] synthase-3